LPTRKTNESQKVVNRNQRLFYALAEPTRREIIELLASRGQLSAGQIYDNFAVSAPAISQHLKVLREADLVQMEKQAQHHLYRINSNAVEELGEWAERMNRLWEERFDALDKVLAEEQKRKNVSKKTEPKSE